MERIEPATLQGPRAYFTDIDHRIVSRSQNKQSLRSEVEHRLKVLLMTKGIVVCAASHLTSPFAYYLFRDNPILLSKGLVVPALRKDRRDIADVFEGTDVPDISRSLKKEMVRFYQDNMTKVVVWDLFDNSSWFRSAFLHHLRTENSVLRRHLKTASKKKIAAMIQKVELGPLLDRTTIEELSQELKGADRISLLKFRELVYHLSGSRVVHCEGNLPQGDYIDYDLSDLSEGNTSLSEVSVFWKIFLELAFDTLRRPNLPIDVLDLLSFDDINQVRQPLLDGGFQAKYDEIVRRSVQAIVSDAPGQTLLQVSEMMPIRDNLASTFAEVFEEEFGGFAKKKSRSLGGRQASIKSGISLALGVATLSPDPITKIPAIIGGTLMGVHAFIVNLSSTLRTPKGVNQYRTYLERREAVLRKIINESKISDKTPLLDAVDVLASYLSERLRV